MSPAKGASVPPAAAASSARDSGSDRDHTPARCAGACRGVTHGLRHRHTFGMHAMRFERCRTYRLEGARADVQREKRARDAARVERGDQPGVEVQARGRRRNRAELAREHALVALTVTVVRRAVNIGWQRRLAVGLEECERLLRQFDEPEIVRA